MALFEIHQRSKGHFLNELRVSFKVSGDPRDDHNLMSMIWRKTLWQLFLYFSVQKETENYKLTYEYSLNILSSGVNLHYIWYILWPTLSFHSKRPQNVLVLLDFSLLDWRVIKNCARDFWLRFYFLRYWPILHFCFLWNRY